MKTKKTETKKAKKKEPEFRPSSETGELIIEHMMEFQDNFEKWTEKGVAAAAKRTRKNLSDIKALITEYRKATIEESKTE